MLRLIIKEGDSPGLCIADVAEKLSVTESELFAMLRSSNDAIFRKLKIANSFWTDGESFSFKSIAGLIQVSPDFELEIVPKFLSENDQWRSEFLFLLSSYRWSAFFPDRQVRYGLSAESTISDVMASIFLSLFDEARHLPIRTYSRKVIDGFELEGELEEESIFFPAQDGFRQYDTRLSKENPYNNVIASAARILQADSQNYELKMSLGKTLSVLGPQADGIKSIPRLVPPRYSKWEKLFQFSLAIIEGRGVDYSDPEELTGPGYIVRTADAWEDFVYSVLCDSLPSCSISNKEPFVFGSRFQSETGKSKNLTATPDYFVRFKTSFVCAADAKYKFSADGKLSVSNADVYECCAFMEASKSQRIVLIYPGAETENPCKEFNVITVPEGTIHAVKINTNVSRGEDSWSSLCNAVGSYFASLDQLS